MPKAAPAPEPRATPSPKPGAKPSVELAFEGRSIPAVPGEPVAVALLRAGERILSRSVKYHRPRGIQCMQEHCAGCLVRVDGLPNRFACTTPCADGMAVARQNAFPNASTDVFRAIDWAFPSTFNHHEMLAGVPVASQVMAKVARKLAGLGELPALPGRAFETVPRDQAEVEARTVLVGLGRVGREHLARLEPGDLAIDATAPGSGEATDERVWRGARVLGLYLEGEAPVLLVRRERAAVRVRPHRLVLAVGSRAQIPPFPGSELPGVLTDLAARLIAGHGVPVGRRAMVVGEPGRVHDTAAVLRDSGVEVTEAPAGSTVVEAHGRHALRGILLDDPKQPEPVRWRGDVLAVAGPRAPAFELASQAGAAIAFVPGRGFAVKTDGAGRTSLPWLLAFGSCTAS
jgi:sarcosine oxidase subunit alpha